MFLSRASEYFLLVLRLSMGWLLFYMGYSKLISTTWTILPELSGSVLAGPLYTMLTSKIMIGVLDTWYPILLMIAGLMILTGLWMKIGAVLSTLLLLLTYIPLIRFPLLTSGAYIVDYHIIYIFVILSLTAMHAGKFWGLDASIRINK